VEDASSELRLFLQGICCDYLLFRHLDEGVPPEAIRIRQEVALGAGVFADIEVRAGQAPPYFVEVDTGYSRERLLQSVRRKYGTPVPATGAAAWRTRSLTVWKISRTPPPSTTSRHGIASMTTRWRVIAASYLLKTRPGRSYLTLVRCQQ
jgi:hypothetical protein